MAITPGQQINASDFVSTSAGAGDSGKVPKLNASGLLDTSFIPEYQSRLKSYSVAENMNGSTTPKAVCINADGNVQLAVADQTGILDKFIGFCTDNITTGEIAFLNNASGITATTSFTPSAGNEKILIVHLSLYKNTAPNIVFPTTVAWNSLNMTLIDSTNPDSTPNDTFGSAVYRLEIGSSTTTANIVATGGTYDNITIQAFCYSNVDQSSPIGTTAKATGTSTAPSVTLNPSTAFSRVVNFIVMSGNPATTVTWNDGQTERDSDLNSSIRSVVADVSNKISNSVAYDATLGASNTWGIQAIELKHSATYPTSNIQIVDRITYSGLTPNAKYYLSNTAGEISTSAGSTSVLLGKALSATELLIIQN